MRYMVIGGAGFIGSHLVSELLNVSMEVCVYDNFFTGKKEFLPVGEKGLSVVSGDILDTGGLMRAMGDFLPERVVHLAALHYIPYCNAHPLETLRVNAEGTQSVIECARRHSAVIKKLVFASSAAVYPIGEGPNREDGPVMPTDVYGISKACGEELVRLFSKESGVPSVSLRMFNVYGPKETNPHVLPEIFGQLRENGRLTLGNIYAKRDFVYVKDVAAAIIMLAGTEGEASCGAFNIGTGAEHSVAEIIDVVRNILGRPIEVVIDERRLRDVDRMHLVADVSRMRGSFGWSPRYDLHSGLRRSMQEMGVL